MNAEKQTRATCAPARDGEALVVLGVRVLGGDRRTPTAVVDVALDGVPVVFAYALLRRDVWEVRAPRDQQGEPALIAPDDLHDRIAEAVVGAVCADEAVSRQLREWRKRRQRAA